MSRGVIFHDWCKMFFLLSWSKFTERRNLESSNNFFSFFFQIHLDAKSCKMVIFPFLFLFWILHQFVWVKGIFSFMIVSYTTANESFLALAIFASTLIISSTLYQCSILHPLYCSEKLSITKKLLQITIDFTLYIFKKSVRKSMWVNSFYCKYFLNDNLLEKQLSSGVFRKGYRTNMPKRTHMPKCDSNKVA